MDGSGSYDPQNFAATALHYRWECYDSPEVTTLTDSYTAQPHFIPNTSGAYKFRLVVSRFNEGISEEGSHSAVRYVQVKVVDDLSDALTAVAGVPLQVALGEKIILDGSSSLPPLEKAASIVGNF